MNKHRRIAAQTLGRPRTRGRLPVAGLVAGLVAVGSLAGLMGPAQAQAQTQSDARRFSLIAPGASKAGTTKPAAERVAATRPAAPKPVTLEKPAAVDKPKNGGGREGNGGLKGGFGFVAKMLAMPGDSRTQTTTTGGGAMPSVPVATTPPAPAPGSGRATPKSIDPQPVVTADTGAGSDSLSKGLGRLFIFRRGNGMAEPGTSGPGTGSDASLKTSPSTGIMVGSSTKPVAPGAGERVIEAPLAPEPIFTRDGRACDALSGQCVPAPRVSTQCVRGACVTAPATLALGNASGASRRGERAQSADAAAPLAEIVPTAAEWDDARRVAGAVAPLSQTQTLANGDTVARVAGCVTIGLRPDLQQPGSVHIDPTGDGLVHTVAPARSVAGLLAHTRFGGIDLATPQSMCLPGDLARSLLRLQDDRPRNVAGRLVRTRDGWALASSR